MPTTATAFADIKDGYYLLKEVNTASHGSNDVKPNGFVKATEEAASGTASPQGSTVPTVDNVDATYIWHIVKEGDYYKVSTANDLAAWHMPDRNNNAYSKDLLDTYANIGTLKFLLVEGSTTQFKVTGSDDAAYIHYCNGNQNTVGSWKDDGVSAMVFEVYDVTDVLAYAPTLKYSFTYNGEEKYSERHLIEDGAAYPDIRATFPFGISATKPEGTVNASEATDDLITKTIELQEDLPFKYATDYASVNNWYYLRLNANDDKNKYLYYTALFPSYIALNTSVDYAYINGYAWAFVGNPFDGFQLVNKAAGENNVLRSAAPTGDGGNTFPYMGNKENADTWTFHTSTHTTDKNGYHIAYGTADITKNSMNDRGKLAYWSGSTGNVDKGSVFWTEEINITDAAALTTIKDRANYLLNVSGTAVGYRNVSEEVMAALTTAISEAVAPAEGTNLFPTMSELNEAMAAVEAVPTVQPDPSKYYRIVSAATSHNYCNGMSVYADDNGALHFQTEVDATPLKYVFQFKQDAEGNTYIYNVERGVYAHTFPTSSQAYAQAFEMLEAKKVVITNLGRENVVGIFPEGQEMMHARKNPTGIVGYNVVSNGDASAWKLVEVEDPTALSHPVTIGAAGWSTLYLGYDATIPEGVEVYVVGSVEEGKANLNPLTDVIPANTAVLLRGDESTYSFAISTATATPVTNELKGTVLTTNITPEEGTTPFVLSRMGGVVGFYDAQLNQSDNTAFQNNAFKAYLLVDNSYINESRSFVFDFGTETGIESIESVETVMGSAAVYDLSGRRVSKAQKGIYIVNGKKVVVK